MDADACLGEANHSLQGLPLHKYMGMRIVQSQPSAVVTMDLTDAIRGVGPIHGGMLVTWPT